MGECLITRRGAAFKLPVLSENYPEDISVAVIKGNTASATFKVEIAIPGTPAEYTYQWYLDGIAIEGATNSIYTKSDISDTGKHTVYCEVTNKKGTVASRIATLDIAQLYTPILSSSYPANASAAVGDSVTCKVVIETPGNPAEYTYQWYKNDSKISGATKSSYSFTPTDLGTTKLHCEVTNSAGTVKSRKATITANKFNLYKSGNQYTDYTGGWTASGYSVGGTSPKSATLEDNYISFVGTDGYFTGRGTSKSIDLANAETLRVKGTVNSIDETENRAFVIAIASTKTGVSSPAAKSYISTTGSFDKTVDVSGLNGKYYVFIYIYGQDSISGRVTEVSLT